jgi:adenine-specific DNA-methyltransferase
MPELQFRGKEFVYNHHLTVPYRPLEMDARKSIGKPNLNGNLIIHSDNLHALKALLPLYAGKVDCIFIDPPYNTGNENWSYNDNVNSPMMREWLSSNPVTIEDGLRHDKWCAMMYPRLKLLHELLSEDGIFWMTLDDNEVHHARTILDEIFGEPHFVAQLVWKSRKAEDTRALSGISTDHEYVLCYAKNGAFRASGVAIDKAKFTNPDNDDRGPWRSADMTGLANAEQRPNLHYVVTDPKTGTEYPTPERGWRYEKSEMLRRIGENRILWPAEPQGRPRQKLFLRELQRTTKNFSSVITFISTGDGSKEIDLIFGSRVFDFPKPSALVQFLIEQSTTPDAVILDSFAGSATTGHAVLAANLKDAGNRRFILVESED